MSTMYVVTVTQITKEFRLPESITEGIIPTEPSLVITSLEIHEIKVSSQRKTCLCRVISLKVEYMIEFFAIYEDELCYNYKGIALVRFLNEMMRQAGVDYGLVYPKLIQTDYCMHLLQIQGGAISIKQMTDSSKEWQFQLTSEKFTSEEKIANFENNVAAFTIFSYVFGGFFHDSSKFQL